MVPEPFQLRPEGGWVVGRHDECGLPVEPPPPASSRLGTPRGYSYAIPSSSVYPISLGNVVSSSCRFTVTATPTALSLRLPRPEPVRGRGYHVTVLGTVSVAELDIQVGPDLGDERDPRQVGPSRDVTAHRPSKFGRREEGRLHVPGVYRLPGVAPHLRQVGASDDGSFKDVGQGIHVPAGTTHPFPRQ